METTKNDLPQKTKLFFYKLSDYLDTKILYFGSVQRTDWLQQNKASDSRFEGESDEEG